MSHEITEIDTQQGIEQAWHGLTKIEPKLSLENCWPSKWDYLTKPLVTSDGLATDFKILVPSDAQTEVLGVPFADSYTMFTNAKLIELLADGFKGSKAKLVSCGTVQRRAKRFFTFKLPELKAFKVGERQFEPFFNLFDAIDKTQPLMARTSNTCIVCANTFAMAKAQKGQTLNVHLRHSRNAAAKLEGLSEAIENAIGQQAEFKAEFEKLMNAPIDEVKAEKFFVGFLARGEELSTRSENQSKRMLQLFNGGAGNNGKNLADVFSATTDYYTHESSGGDDLMKQFTSSEFGSGSRMKGEVWDILTEPKRPRVAELIKAGEKSMSLAAA
jgi:hypothetical protein